MGRLTNKEAHDAILRGSIVGFGERCYRYNKAREKLEYKDTGERDWKESTRTLEEFRDEGLKKERAIWRVVTKKTARNK